MIAPNTAGDDLANGRDISQVTVLTRTGWLTPAECCFEAFGGPAEVAHILGTTRQTIWRWVERGGREMRNPGSVPVHHIRQLLTEAKKRGKRLTLEDIVFGRDAAKTGIVVVKSGIKVQIKAHDIYQSMVTTLEGL